MRMLPPWAALALVATLAAAVPPPAAAGAAGAAETCEGKPATVVGTGVVTGTEDDDVIVALSPTTVAALGGDDLICLGARGGPTAVDAGSGDDRVAVSDPAARQAITTTLGAGLDEYLGGATRDYVSDDDADADEIRTGGGTDGVTLGHDGPVTETVHLGSGSDGLGVAGVVSDGADLDGGPEGDATLGLPSSGYAAGTWLPGWHVRNGAVDGTARLEGRAATLSFRNFDGFVVDDGVIESFVGGPRDESVQAGVHYSALEPGGPGIRYASMGGGDDYVSPLVAAAGEPARRSYGGTGIDTMTVVLADDEDGCCGDVVADLRRGSVTYRRGIELARVSGMDNYSLEVFGRATVIGSDRDETIHVRACDATVKAGAGRDDIHVGGLSENCGEPDSRLYGGRGSDRIDSENATVYGGDGHDRVTAWYSTVYGEVGNDVLIGSAGRERLYGGAGRDSADGRGGTDTCRAERRVRCER